MKKLSKRLLSLMLAVIMAMPVILAMPFTANAATVNSVMNEHLVAQYFTDSNLTADKSGHGYSLEQVGNAASWTNESNIDCVKFPGGNKTNYYRVRLNNILSNADLNHGITVTFRAKRSGDGWQRFFELSQYGGLGDGTQTSYVYFSPNDSGSSKFMNTSFKTNSQSSAFTTGIDDNWHSYAMVIYDGFATLHKDGRYWSRLDDTDRIREDWLNNIKSGYLLIGGSSYEADPAFQGWMRDFRVYDTALNSTQLRLASTDANNNHAAVDVNYETSVDFHGLEGKTYSREGGVYYYSPTDKNYGLIRQSTAESFNNDDNMRYFRMWDKNDKLRYNDSASPAEGVFQSKSDFRFDAWFGARNDTNGPYLIAIENKNGGLPIQLLKNGNIKVNNTEITGVNAVYSGSNEKYHISYTFSFDYSEQMLHFSAWGEYTDNNGNYNMQKTKDVKVTDYGLTLDPGNLKGINFLDGSGNGHVRFGGVSFYTPANQTKNSQFISVAKEYVKANMGNYSKTSDVNTFNAKAYHYSNEATDGYANVVWCPQGDDTTTADGGDHDQDWLRYCVFFQKNIVIAYDGVHKPAVPVVLEMWLSDAWAVSPAKSRWVRCSHWEINGQPFKNDHKWRGYTESNEGGDRWKVWPGSIYTTDDNAREKIGYSPGQDNDFKVDNKSTRKWFWNKMNYTGSVNTTDYFEKHSNLSIRMYRSNNNNASGFWDNDKIANNNHNIYVINYKPIYDKIDALKSTYNTVAANGDDYYTEDSLNQFYCAAYKFMTCSPKNSYDYSTCTYQAVAQNAGDIKDSLAEYSKINLIRRADFSALDTAYSSAKTKLNQSPQAYTNSTLNSLRTAFNKIVYAPDNGTYYRPNMKYSDYQNAINAETTSLNNSINALEGLASFSALDEAKDAAIAEVDSAAIVDANTTSSVAAAKAYLQNANEFPYEYSAVRNDTGVSKNSKIAAETTKFNNWKAAGYLDKLADLTYFDAEFDKANTFLMNLDGKTAEYTADSVQAVIDAVTAAGNAQGSNKSVQTIATANAATRKVDFGQKVQADANAFADDIRDAMAGLEKASSVVSSTDTSAFEAAVEKLNNIDPDAYDVSEGDIASIRRSANATISSSESQKEYNGTTINVLNDNITQQDIDDATTAITTALTVSTKRYTINKSDDGADFDISSKNGTYENGSATYGTTLVCNSGDADTAWYLEIQTGSMHKKMAFAGNGQRLQTKVLGTTTIKAVKRATGQKKVRILRQYDNAEITDRSPVQAVDYVSGEFTLPAATAIAYYTFSGYYVGGTQYAAGDVVSISEDTDIIAKYTADANANCAINATGYTGTVKYNDKVELTGNDDAYAWVEEVDSLGTHYRPFYIGKNVSFFASESANLKAVTKSEFDAFKFSLPTVNLRKSGVVSEGAKTIFNAQIVPGDANVQEYGILIAAPYGATPAASIDATQVVIENSGKHASEGYQVLRAKSTKLVGANQFTISVNGIPSGYIYRGYLIYADSNGNLHNVYSEAMR